MKILLTGGSGFIGKNIIRILGQKYNIVAPNRSELNIVDQNSVDEYLKNNKFDVVIHCAILNPSKNANDKAEDILDYTMRGLFNLKKHERELKKIIYIGSGAEFDKSSDIVDVTESDIGTIIPKDSYGYAKYILNQIANTSENIYNLRIFGCYGQGEQERRLIRSVITNILENKNIQINQDCYFSYILVDDLVKLIDWFLINTPKYHDYNICNPQKYKLLEIVKIVRAELNSNADIVIAKSGLNKEYSGCCSRLLKEIPNFEFTPIEKGIKQEIDWIKEIKQ